MVLTAALPYVIELPPEIDALRVFDALAELSHCVFLDSARQLPTLGRYSFVAADPFVVLSGAGQDQLGSLATQLSKYAVTNVPNLPPLQGGAIGCFAYDLAHSLERLPKNRFDEFAAPQLWFGLYDTVFAFDHAAQRGWLISQGFPATDERARRIRAERRAAWFLDMVHQNTSAQAQGAWSPPFDDDLRQTGLAPQYETRYAGVLSNFREADYRSAVASAVDYIRAGDIFQVNLSQRLMKRATASSPKLYRRLRDCNPAPFACYLDVGEQQIISASPERFLQVRDRHVETRPIKGTRPRLRTAEANLFAGAELVASEKDLAENVMIVDLMRNDLSRSCLDDSVHVPQLCELEIYEHVQHLVSVVCGVLRDDVTNIDLVQRAFPGGSITGAPKVRAMEIIAELEPTARNFYCGSLGYLGFDGSVDLNILIRTITASHGWWRFPVGGGIVVDSDPDAELEETWTKAQGIIQAVEMDENS